MLAVMAFFLPWIAVSCNDNTIGSVSPYDRAAGIQVQSDLELGETIVSVGDANQSMPPQRGYWLLLLVAGALAVVGLAMTVTRRIPLRTLGAVGALLAFVGLFTTIALGLGDRLGIDWPDAIAPGVTLQVVFEPGVWISVVGYSLALAGAVSTLVLGQRVDTLE